MYPNPCSQYPVPVITLEALQLLLDGMSTGEKRIKYADKEVEYHSVGDMQKLYVWMLRMYQNSCAPRMIKVAAEYESGLNSPSDLPETGERINRHWC